MAHNELKLHNFKEHIRKNLAELLQCTEVNVKLRAILLQNGIITEEEDLNLKGPNVNKLQASSMLYELIKTREEKGFLVLVKALRETKQTEACSILSKVIITNIESDPTKSNIYGPRTDDACCEIDFCDIRYARNQFSDSDSIEIKFRIPVGCCRSKRFKRLFSLVIVMVVVAYMAFVWAHYIIGI